MGDETTVVLTPTARLARAENQRLADERVQAGQSAWLRPSVLSFSAWLNRLRDDYFLISADARAPIAASQALVLWQEVINRDIFIGEPRVAELAAAAWRLIHEHRLQAPAEWPTLLMSEDNRQFRAWAGRFEALCAERGLIDEWAFAAQIPALIRRGEIEPPESAVLLGFDLPPTPLQQAVIDALEGAGTRIEHRQPPGHASDGFVITAFTEPEEEMLAAARWARSRLEENPEQTLAVVVPDLHGRVEDAERAFRQVFDPPGFALSPEGSEPWHVSLGPALNAWPLVADGLALLGLDPRRISQPEAGHLLRSPFLAGWNEEYSARANLIARLIRFAPFDITPRELIYQAGRTGAGIFAEHLAGWQQWRRENGAAAMPSVWAGRFQKELNTMGFGKGRGLDSREYQVLQRWHELLETFAALDVVIARPLSRSRALSLLNERAGSPRFRERNTGVPVEILGVDEALGSRFEAMWITTLDAEHWPKPARRDPLIPADVQSDVPQATSAGCLARARLELDGLISAAPVVTGSLARGSGEQALEVTRLLADYETVESDPAELTVPVEPEILSSDVHAPALDPGKARGGTRVLQNQSNCPFRAFAEHRLGAVDLSPPRPGLDAGSRGSLVHKALEFFWQDLDGSQSLKQLEHDALDQHIRSAADNALDEFSKHNHLALSAAGRQLEATCLRRTLSHWIALEKNRDDFRINALEEGVSLKFGKLELSGKIDRIDELEGGGSVLIDYKTGQSGRNGWAPAERMVDVQLPAYAVNMDPPPVAISFARIRPEALSFDGLAEVDPGMDGIEMIGQITRKPFKEIESWQTLLGDWRGHLDALADEFLGGHAAVDPRDNSVCRYCHLHNLCRINERVALPEADDD